MISIKDLRNEQLRLARELEAALRPAVEANQRLRELEQSHPGRFPTRLGLRALAPENFSSWLGHLGDLALRAREIDLAFRARETDGQKDN